MSDQTLRQEGWYRHRDKKLVRLYFEGHWRKGLLYDANTPISLSEALQKSECVFPQNWTRLSQIEATAMLLPVVLSNTFATQHRPSTPNQTEGVTMSNTSNTANSSSILRTAERRHEVAEDMLQNAQNNMQEAEQELAKAQARQAVLDELAHFAELVADFNLVIEILRYRWEGNFSASSITLKHADEVRSFVEAFGYKLVQVSDSAYVFQPIEYAE